MILFVKMQNMFVVPVPFSKEHKHMLAHCKELLEYREGQVAINPKFMKLITALRITAENGGGVNLMSIIRSLSTANDK
jgi:hypothetical protein